jgi:hypothetical protein
MSDAPAGRDQGWRGACVTWSEVLYLGERAPPGRLYGAEWVTDEHGEHCISLLCVYRERASAR